MKLERKKSSVYIPLEFNRHTITTMHDIYDSIIIKG